MQHTSQPQDGERYFTNPFITTPSTSVESEVLRKSYLDFIDSLFTAHVDYYSKDKTKDVSIYTGPGGLALTYWRLAAQFKQHNDSERSIKFHSAAMHFLNTSLARIRGRGITFVMGDVGIYALAAVMKLDGDYIAKVLSFLPDALEPSLPEQEILYGRAGYLYALLFLSKYVPEKSAAAGVQDAMAKVATALVHTGAKYVQSSKSGSPLMYEWHGKRYLGAAHGLIGIVYLLLDVLPLLQQHNTSVRKQLEGTLDFLLTQRTSTGNWTTREGKAEDGSAELVQWCHGAVGASVLFSKAYRVFDKNSRYLTAACEAADHVWKFGLLKKGPGLCHGVAGNAYSFLAVYSITRDAKYLQHARDFASWLISNKKGRNSFAKPDHPFSLFEGSAGASCFLADLLLHPEQATFPAFDL